MAWTAPPVQVVVRPVLAMAGSVDPVAGPAARIDTVIAQVAAQVATIDDSAGYALGDNRIVVATGLHPAPDRLESFGREIG